MELGLLALDHHRTVSFKHTTHEKAPNAFAQMVAEHMRGYDDASGGDFDRTPMTISFCTERKSVMLVGKITEDLYERVRQRVNFELRRRVFSENGF
jgi:hypothetical protein